MNYELPITLRYQTFIGQPSTSMCRDVFSLSQQIFHFAESFQDLCTFLNSREQLFVLVTYHQEKPVGFKVAFKLSDHVYESWRGGVLEDYRRLGIASECMRRQHAWCRVEGVVELQTVTNIDNHVMLALNESFGYQRVESFTNELGVSKIRLSRYFRE